MKQIVAVKSIRYAGRSYKPGESFQAREKDARLLTLIGKAKAHVAEPDPSVPEPPPAPAPDPEPVPKPEPVAVVADVYGVSGTVSPDVEDAPAQAEDLTPPRRRYKRRDMVAEE